MDCGARPRAIVAVRLGGIEIMIGRIVDLKCDLELVDALARLQLAAVRFGGALRLHQVSPSLNELLDLVGMAELVAEDGP